MLFKIAFRNILRNRRRSGMTMVAVALGAVAMLIFGAFMASLVLGFKSSTIASNGHLSIYERGYLDYGSGDPGGYSIPRYGDVMALIGKDPELGPRIAVITPRVSLTGIAGNFSIDRSRTFFGIAFIPSDRDRMAHWDEYGVRKGRRIAFLDMVDNDRNGGVIGTGLARVLGFCEQLRLGNCPPAPKAPQVAADNATPGPGIDLAELSARDLNSGKGTAAAPPRIDLLAATAGGAPNVVSLTVRSTSEQSLKDADDAYVGLPLSLGQELLYGRGESKATSIVLQLHHTADIGLAKTRLKSLFSREKLDLDVHDFVELTPMYKQIVTLFGSILGFIAIIMGVIVLFTVANTMSMSVMERTSEIGTIRALGVQRAGIRIQFLTEGLMLGVIGATSGVIVAILVAMLVNRSGLSWMPPGQTTAVPLRLLIANIPELIAATWIGLIVMSAIAALLPANNASRMTVVDALRHI